ncbi:uncharacterized protein LOC106088958 [Stomoxys calcitrans]|uniref:uncharacterized protein LOC106088958 n=1 Tax=Stomoxys calcitrans TaxID=35570 RepID=UPI0027E3AAD6|nr:uncharacterized protein LOC106088958 [Stomoxys calcitrans]
MVGSTCCFRDCVVTTSGYPTMHFFRFPLKDHVRFRSWIRYCQAENMDNMNYTRQKNRAVCARHFRDELFMNYRKERLVKWAVPTIFRLSANKALDFDLDLEHGVLITIPAPVDAHLVPPLEFKCPLALENDVHLLKKLKELNLKMSHESLVHSDKEVNGYNTRIKIEEGIHFTTGDTSQDSYIFLINHTDEVFNCKREKDEPESEYAQVFTANKRIKIEDVNSEYLDTSSKALILSSNQTHEAITRKYQTRDKEKLVISRATIASPLRGRVTSKPELRECNKINPSKTYSTTSLLDKKTCASNRAITITNAFTLSEPLQLSTKLSNESAPHTLCQTKLSQTAAMQVNSSASNYLDIETPSSLQHHKKLLTVRNANDLKDLPIVPKTGATLNEKQILESRLLHFQRKSMRKGKVIKNLMVELFTANRENKSLRKRLKSLSPNFLENCQLPQQCKEYEVEVQKTHSKSLTNDTQCEIRVLQTRLEVATQQLKELAKELRSSKENCDAVQKKTMIYRENAALAEHKFKVLKSKYDSIVCKYLNLSRSHEDLGNRVEGIALKDKRIAQIMQNKLKALNSDNDKTTNALISTANTCSEPAISGLYLKTQLLNSITGYINDSMLALLRMEMFGGPEREWKPDERQIAVDLLCLGETVYKYFTDVWRLRLPRLQDARIWAETGDEKLEEDEE